MKPGAFHPIEGSDASKSRKARHCYQRVSDACVMLVNSLEAVHISSSIQLHEAVFDPTPLTRAQRVGHWILGIKGLLDALAVAVRDPDVFALQVSLWRDGGLRGWYQFRRLRELSRLLRERDVSVIEFGSGASSLLIAKRARRAVSIEEGDRWAEKLVRALQTAWWVKPELRGLTIRQVVVCSRREWQDAKGEWVCGYSLSPDVREVSWDVAYVDGPTNWPQDEPSVASGVSALPNADVLTLAALPSEIWVDGRRDTLRYLARSLPDDYLVRTEMRLPRRSRRLFHTLFARRS